jgi:transaldolase
MSSLSLSLSPLHRLSALGQSVWIDFLSRTSIHGGHLQELIDHDAVVGATSNPTIFQKAMSEGDAYDEQLRALAGEGVEGKDAFWRLASDDVRDACDLFRPIWEAGSGRDGYVSLEVDPGLAYDGPATFAEAMRLHKLVDRPNLMVKIPATKPGLAAIEDAIAKGKSINVTLIFSLRRYAEVAESYVRGIERLIAAGGDPSKVASVASFFVSRIDTEADRRLEELGAAAADGAPAHGAAVDGASAPHDAAAYKRLQGQLAVANARLAYQHYKSVFRGERWQFLAGKGATPQRVLWASTSTKNPAFPDTLYVEDLIGPDTVNTMPEETIHAYQDHGRPQLRLEGGSSKTSRAPRYPQSGGLQEARRLLSELADAGVDYDDVTETLEREGVQKFSDSFQQLLDALREKTSALAVA